MGYSERLSEDLLQAMRDKDKVRLSVLRMVKSAVKYAEIDLQRALTDAEIIAVLRKEVKQRKETLQTLQGTDRPDYITELEAELAVLYHYLPVSLSDEAILSVVQDVITALGATSKADLGKVMAAVRTRIGAQAEGQTISRIVQEALSAL